MQQSNRKSGFSLRGICRICKTGTTSNSCFRAKSKLTKTTTMAALAVANTRVPSQKVQTDNVTHTWSVGAIAQCLASTEKNFHSTAIIFLHATKCEKREMMPV